MEELQVLVQQTPGVISWNYEDLKAALQEKMSVYEGMIYDDDSIKSAKADVAMLRKLRKEVEDRRKEIKANCLEPYAAIEVQAKELTGIIDKPIEVIAGRVKEYEDQQKAARKQRILSYMAEKFSTLPQKIQKKAQFAVYDTRWENATAKEADWKEAINTFYNKVSSDLGVLKTVDDDFKADACAVYSQNLNLLDALEKVTELQQQREMLLERQRQKQEELRRLEAQEAAKAATTVQAAQSVEAQTVKQQAVNNHAQVTQNIESMPVKVTVPDKQDNAAAIRLLDASEAQVQKVLDYINFMGIKYEVTTWA